MSARSPTTPASTSSRPTRRERRREARLRNKYIKAAMPNAWHSTAEMQDLYLRAMSRVASSGRSPRGSPAQAEGPAAASTPFPWEMKITPPPPRPKVSPLANLTIAPKSLSPEQQAKMDAAAAAKDAAKKAAMDEAAKKAAAVRAKQEEAAERRARAEAREKEIESAAKEAADAAAAAPALTVEVLSEMQKERETKKAEYTEEV